MAAQVQTRPSPLARNHYIPAHRYMKSTEEISMGIVLADIKWLSGEDMIQFRKGSLPEDRVRRVKVTALIDSSATSLCINQAIREQLGLIKVDEQVVEYADGARESLDVVGPVEVRFQNRHTTVDAIVLPGDSEVLLGAVPIENMDVMIDLKNQRLIVNPASPYVATSKAK